MYIRLRLRRNAKAAERLAGLVREAPDAARRMRTDIAAAADELSRAVAAL